MAGSRWSTRLSCPWLWKMVAGRPVLLFLEAPAKNQEVLERHRAARRPFLLQQGCRLRRPSGSFPGLESLVCSASPGPSSGCCLRWKTTPPRIIQDWPRLLVLPRIVSGLVAGPGCAVLPRIIRRGWLVLPLDHPRTSAPFPTSLRPRGWLAGDPDVPEPGGCSSGCCCWVMGLTGVMAASFLASTPRL